MKVVFANFVILLTIASEISSFDYAIMKREKKRKENTYLHLHRSRRSGNGHRSSLSTTHKQVQKDSNILRKSFSGSIAFFNKASNHTASSFVLIQSLAEFLTHGLKMLLQSEGLQHHAIPLILQGNKKTGDARSSHRFRLDNGLRYFD